MSTASAPGSPWKLMSREPSSSMVWQFSRMVVFYGWQTPWQGGMRFPTVTMAEVSRGLIGRAKTLRVCSGHSILAGRREEARRPKPWSLS